MTNRADTGVLWAMCPGFGGLFVGEGLFDDLVPAGLRALAAGVGAEPKQPTRQVGRLKVIPLAGTLSLQGSRRGTSTDRFTEQVLDAGADRAVNALVLDIMSGGGQFYGIAEAADAVWSARQLKPVIAVANPFCLSAAHWIASQASSYLVTPSGQVGSMGIYTSHTDRSGMEGKVGLVTTLLANSPDKVAAHPHAPLSDHDRAMLQGQVNEANAAFVAAVARGRGIRPAAVPAIHGTGKLFSARDAAARGMTDGVASLRDTLARYANPSQLDLLAQRDRLRMAGAGQ